MNLHVGFILFVVVFISNFILLLDKAEKKVQFNEEVKVKVLDNEKSEPVKIDESKIDRLLHLLHEADPQSDKADSEELLTLEGNVCPVLNCF